MKFNVSIVDRFNLNYAGQCKNQQLKIGKFSLSSDFYVIPLGGIDVVIGTQWLETLGEFKMNMTELYIKFQQDGKDIILKGIRPSPPKAISGHKMEKHMQAGACSFMLQIYPKQSEFTTFQGLQGEEE
eukprot:Gb_21318 [translate_table: standard]